MTTISLAQIRAKVRRLADFPNADQGKLDTDLNDMINDACAEYFDRLVVLRGHSYFETSATWSVVSGTAAYTFASDFYQLSTVTFEWGGDDHERVQPLASNVDIALFTNTATWERYGPKGYRVTGTQGGTKTLTFYPTPRANVTARYRYVPAFVPLANDAATIDCENAWWKLIAATVAAEFRGLLGLPNDYLKTMVAEQQVRIDEMATERIQDDPAEIVDTETRGPNWFPPGTWNSAV